ncbi:hypothetical protein [Nocardia inohanensis]|uniref:hypothetical protein n=1 Tax=Nocardia inohanensis TaxID=209246 RepID=UPI000831A208|nr:hypothetical protein [Nocardia inohanensis]
MAVLRTCAALTAVPALVVLGTGNAAAEAAGSPVAAGDSNSLRVGSETVQLPGGIDPGLREQAQAYLDGVQGRIATTFDNMGFSRNESDRRNAATVAGGIIGAAVGKVVVFPLEIVGCGVGAVAGAIAGGVIGALPTVGAGAPVGAAVGGVAGCLLGGLAVAIPVDVAGLVGGAVIGGAAGGALGAGGGPVDAALPIVNTLAGQSDSTTPEPVAADAIAAVSTEADAAVTSLRTAIDAMPPLTPNALGPLTQPVNDLLGAVQAAL